MVLNKNGPLTFTLLRFLKYLSTFIWLQSSNYSQNRFFPDHFFTRKNSHKKRVSEHTDEYSCKIRILCIKNKNGESEKPGFDCIVISSLRLTVDCPTPCILPMYLGENPETWTNSEF